MISLNWLGVILFSVGNIMATGKFLKTLSWNDNHGLIRFLVSKIYIQKI